ncbi:MAG: dTDP-glucose 4,6-dehydratase [Alphaproteobacteria bacterium]
MRVAITGAAGFIGSALCRHILAAGGTEVHGIDRLTYAANPVTLTELRALQGFIFHQTDIADATAIRATIQAIRPDAIIHLAAETHVDRSIDQTAPFIATNLGGTYNLLEAALDLYRTASPAARARFRFLHISTDEVYGSLGTTGAFSETSSFAPNSPYAASKAGAEHLARAWQNTYDLPVIITNCSNNYGPYQYPEKLIPHMILKALNGAPLPVYGRGANVRDWLYVDDHAAALWLILQKGLPGEKYHIGGRQEMTNLALVESLCDLLDTRMQDSALRPHKNLIRFVGDRPGHDFRYAMNIDKIGRELGWAPAVPLAEGLARTVDWYLARQDWVCALETRYAGERLGLGKTPGHC